MIGASGLFIVMFAKFLLQQHFANDEISEYRHIQSQIKVS